MPMRNMFFQAEGSLKNGEENVLPPTCVAALGTPGVQTVAVKCDLCDFLPEGPACVRACPNQALRLITDDSLQRQMKEKTAPCRKLVCQWRGRIPLFPHSGATLMDALQLLTRVADPLSVCQSGFAVFYSVWTDWLLSFPASHRWWAA